jgi:hypothetical protein
MAADDGGGWRMMVFVVFVYFLIFVSGSRFSKRRIGSDRVFFLLFQNQS